MHRFFLHGMYSTLDELRSELSYNSGCVSNVDRVNVCRATILAPSEPTYGY